MKSENLSDVITDLQQLQRQRRMLLGTRIKLENRFYAIVAVNELGYEPVQNEKDRDGIRKKAEAYVKSVLAGEQETSILSFIQTSHDSVQTFAIQCDIIEKAMEKRASDLPIADWIEEPDQKGVSFLSLAKIIGEAGDLSNYPKVYLLWKRFGLTPIINDGHTRAASWWSRNKKRLSADQWIRAGYSPRLRS